MGYRQQPLPGRFLDHWRLETGWQQGVSHKKAIDTLSWCLVQDLVRSRPRSADVKAGMRGRMADGFKTKGCQG